MSIDDISSLKPVASVYDEDEFWALIDQSLQMSEDEQMEFLINELTRLCAEDIIAFGNRILALTNALYNSELWCAGYIMNGGCSDDGFEYFCRWIVSRGKEVYYEAIKDPDSLISQVKDGDEADFYYEHELFAHVATDAFKNKFGVEIWDYFDSERFREKWGCNFDIQFNWDELQPETMKALCPRLYERLYN